MFHSPQVSPLQDSPSMAPKNARFGSREVLQASRNFSGNAPEVLAAKIDRLISSRAFGNAPDVLAAQVDCLISSRGPREVHQAFRNPSGNAPKFLAAKVDHLIRSRVPSYISGNAPEVLAAKVDHLISCRGTAVPAVFGKVPSYISGNAPEVLAAKVDHLISCRGTAVPAVFGKGRVLRPTRCKAVHCILPHKPHGDTLWSQWVTNDMEHCGVLQYSQPPHQRRSQRVTLNTGSFVPPRALKKTSVFQSRTQNLPRKREQLLEQLNVPKINVNYLPKPRVPAPPCFSRNAQCKPMQCIMPHETDLDRLRSQQVNNYMGNLGFPARCPPTSPH